MHTKEELQAYCNGMTRAKNDMLNHMKEFMNNCCVSCRYCKYASETEMDDHTYYCSNITFGNDHIKSDLDYCSEFDFGGDE